MSLNKLHISTGWVTVGEIIRFLIHELKVKPRSANWDELLHESEDTFRMLTSSMRDSLLNAVARAMLRRPKQNPRRLGNLFQNRSVGPCWHTGPAASCIPTIP